jgi:hypothetical protein
MRDHVPEQDLAAAIRSQRLLERFLELLERVHMLHCTRVRGAHQVSNHPHVSCQYRPHRCDLSPINKGAPHIHHDALELPDGEIVLLTRLCEGQRATVLTLPTQPKSAAEADAQQRIAYAG